MFRSVGTLNAPPARPRSHTLRQSQPSPWAQLAFAVFAGGRSVSTDHRRYCLSRYPDHSLSLLIPVELERIPHIVRCRIARRERSEAPPMLDERENGRRVVAIVIHVMPL